MKNNRKGVSIAEAAIGLIVVAVATAGISSIVLDQSNSAKNAQTAKHMATVADAAVKYVNANKATLLGAAGPTTPIAVTAAQLKASGFLPSSFSTTNVNGQTYSLLVKEPNYPAGHPSAGTPSGSIEAVLVTTGGEAFEDKDMTEIVAGIGAAGGGMLSGATSVTGAQSGWTISVPSWTTSDGTVLPTEGRPVAHLSFDVNMNDAAGSGGGASVDLSPYLSRVNNGDVDANSMETTLFTRFPDSGSRTAISFKSVAATAAGNPDLQMRKTAADAFQMRGWNGSAVEGTMTLAFSDVRAPILTDSNNTAFFVDPNSSSVLNDVTATTMTTSALNAPRLVDSDDPAFFVNPNGVSEMYTTRLNGGNLNTEGGTIYTATGTVSSSQFIDSDNTSFFVDPNSSSIMNIVNSSNFVDRDNNTFFVNPNSTSELLNVNLNGGNLNTEGGNVTSDDVILDRICDKLTPQTCITIDSLKSSDTLIEGIAGTIFAPSVSQASVIAPTGMQNYFDGSDYKKTYQSSSGDHSFTVNTTNPVATAYSKIFSVSFGNQFAMISAVANETITLKNNFGNQEICINASCYSTAAGIPAARKLTSRVIEVRKSPNPQTICAVVERDSGDGNISSTGTICELVFIPI